MRTPLLAASLPLFLLVTGGACVSRRAAPQESAAREALPPPPEPKLTAVAEVAPTASALPRDESAPAGSPKAGAGAHESADFGLGGGMARAGSGSVASTPFIANANVRAGEWDDNANYRDFMRYLANEERVPYHRVDLANRRFLVVRDAEGKAVPRCSVTVADASEHLVTLTTTASGRAILFPHAEGLVCEGQGLTARASCNGQSVTAGFTLETDDDVVPMRLQAKRELPAARVVDIAFILDTTGSMNEEIAAVKSTIAKVAQSLASQDYRPRLGLVEYKDRRDEFVTRVHAFSANTAGFLADVANVSASGGGDYPESVNQGLHDGLTKLDWGTDAVAKFAFLIGDAPPHLDYANDSDYALDMRQASHQGIQVFTVAASGMDELGQAVWRQIAGYTGGTNLFVLRGGAGPQSVGAGDPKSSCGGTQTQYASGNLDVLLTRKITGELKGIDADPMRIAGLRQDESAKPCNERVAMQ